MATVELEHEFAGLEAEAAAHGLPWSGLPKLRRRWVAAPSGGHVSGVVWGSGTPAAVLVPAEGRSARSFDATLLALGRPAVAVDLLGHGRSSERRDGRYVPSTLAPGLVDAIRSYAVGARVVVGVGLGGLVAIAAARRSPRDVPALVLVDVTPASSPAALRAAAGIPAAPFADRDAAVDAVAATLPTWDRAAVARRLEHDLVDDGAGALGWRHVALTVPEPADEDVEPLWDVLAGFVGPVVLVRAGRGSSVADADVDRLLAVRPGAVVHTIAEAGPDLAEERPAELAAIVADVA